MLAVQFGVLVDRVIVIITHSLVGGVFDYGLAFYSPYNILKGISPVDAALSNRAAARIAVAGSAIRRDVRHSFACTKSFMTRDILETADFADRPLRKPGTAATSIVTPYFWGALVSAELF